MKTWVLPALIAGILAGVIGFGLGRRTAGRTTESGRPAPSGLSTPTPRASAESPPAPKKADEVSAAAPTTTAKVESLPEEGISSKRKLINLVGSLLSEDKHYHALRSMATSDPAIQKRIFEELMSTRDASMLDAAKDCFYGVRDAALIQQIVDAFTGETWHDRRAVLATMIGMNLESEATRPLFEAILSGTDTRLQESALERMCVQNVDRHAEFASRLSVQLRQLVTGGATPELRARAAASLRGDRSKEGVDFLIDRMLNDTDPTVQMRAMVALPVTYSGGGMHEREQFQGMLHVALDESRSEKMRRWAADRVIMGTFRYKDLLTEEQRALMTKLAGRTDTPPLKGKGIFTWLR